MVVLATEESKTILPNWAPTIYSYEGHSLYVHLVIHH